MNTANLYNDILFSSQKNVKYFFGNHHTDFSINRLDPATNELVTYEFYPSRENFIYQR